MYTATIESKLAPLLTFNPHRNESRSAIRAYPRCISAWGLHATLPGAEHPSEWCVCVSSGHTSTDTIVSALEGNVRWTTALGNVREVVHTGDVCDCALLNALVEGVLMVFFLLKSTIYSDEDNWEKHSLYRWLYSDEDDGEKVGFCMVFFDEMFWRYVPSVKKICVFTIIYWLIYRKCFIGWGPIVSVGLSVNICEFTLMLIIGIQLNIIITPNPLFILGIRSRGYSVKKIYVDYIKIGNRIYQYIWMELHPNILYKKWKTWKNFAKLPNYQKLSKIFIWNYNYNLSFFLF